MVTIAVTVWDFKRRVTFQWFDVILFAITGLIGILLAFLWFFTNHAAAAKNFNLLWAFPFHFIAAIALFRSPKWLTKYFLFTTVLVVVTLLGWPLWPQTLHYALVPFVAALGIRAFAQFYFRNAASRNAVKMREITVR